MQNDKIKEAFAKVKEDMNFLHQEIEGIKRTLEDLKTPTRFPTNPTLQHKTPTLQHPLEAVKSQNMPISTGNEGVPTNQPTNQPTLQHPPISTESPQIDRISHLKRVSKILESLDEIKKDVRIKFKRLTNKEMLIYSTIYQLEEQGLFVDYSIISEKLNLSEISIRDYIRKIMKKGIPLEKLKGEGNKILLKIPQELKKIASLRTIIQLRGL